MQAIINVAAPTSYTTSATPTAVASSPHTGKLQITNTGFNTVWITTLSTQLRGEAISVIGGGGRAVIDCDSGGVYATSNGSGSITASPVVFADIVLPTGSTSPIASLVNNPVTVDSGGTVQIAAAAVGAKALVVQRYSNSQTANLIEIEKQDGTLLSAFGPGGQLAVQTAVAASQAVSINTGADANKGIVLARYSVSQSANLLEIQTSVGALLSAIGPGGFFGIGGAPVSTTALYVNTVDAANIALHLQRVASQSANIMQVLNESASSLFVISASGSARFYRPPGLVGTQSFATLSGAMGTISAQSSPYVVCTGSTAGGTLNMPATSLQDGMIITVKNRATVSVTLSGNGINIDVAGTSAATQALAAGAVKQLRYDSTLTRWEQIN